MLAIVIIYIIFLIILYNCIDIMTNIYYNIIVARDKLHKLLSRRKATERGTMKDLNLTSEQLELLESLTEEQQDVFEFAVNSRRLDIEEALNVAENEEYHLFESVYELVDFLTYETGYSTDDLPHWFEINYWDAWFGYLGYEWDFLDGEELYEGANRYASGEAAELWRKKSNWQFENSRVISLDF